MATITQRDNGRWQARVRRRGQPAISRAFNTKANAEAWARKVESEQERGVWRDTSTAETLSVADLFDEYTKSVPHKANTHAYLMKRLAEDLGRYSLTALTPAVLIAWRDRRLQCVAPATVQRELSALGGALTWAIKDRLIGLPSNPVSAVRRPPAGKARERRLEPNEEQRLLEALEDRAGAGQGVKRKGAYRVGARNPWIRPLFQLALETAMRRGELLKLTWENVNLKAHTAYLPDTKDPKGRPRDRTVPLSSRAVAILSSLAHSEDGRVFPISANAVRL
ncbi:shufflon-specific recombinase, partial [mine drainage metagenome]